MLLSGANELLEQNVGVFEVTYLPLEAGLD